MFNFISEIEFSEEKPKKKRNILSSTGMVLRTAALPTAGLLTYRQIKKGKVDFNNLKNAIKNVNLNFKINKVDDQTKLQKLKKGILDRDNFIKEEVGKTFTKSLPDVGRQIYNNNKEKLSEATKPLIKRAKNIVKIGAGGLLTREVGTNMALIGSRNDNREHNLKVKNYYKNKNKK